MHWLFADYSQYNSREHSEWICFAMQLLLNMLMFVSLYLPPLTIFSNSLFSPPYNFLSQSLDCYLSHLLPSRLFLSKNTFYFSLPDFLQWPSIFSSQRAIISEDCSLKEGRWSKNCFYSIDYCPRSVFQWTKAYNNKKQESREFKDGKFKICLQPKLLGPAVV